MNPPLRSLDDLLTALRISWRDYGEDDNGFEHFVEFTLTLNSLAGHLARLRLPGLVRQCEGLETAALALFGDPQNHPISAQSREALNRQIETLLGSIATARHSETDVEQRLARQMEQEGVEWIKQRTVWMMVAPHNDWAQGLSAQLAFYGFRVVEMPWGSDLPDDSAPLAVLFIPAAAADKDQPIHPEALAEVARVRPQCAAAQIFYVGAPRNLECMVKLIRAGVDVAIEQENQTATLLSRILDLVQTRAQERYRVLVVEDSRVAVAMIQRALQQHDIDSHAIEDPRRLLEVLETYRPDVVLMDMYMPMCNGVEATRVLRQTEAYQALPVIYLSSETDIGLQVEALRLGGDHFLTKPFNAVLLAATVRTTIERHREMQRASRYDGLTGLLNHTAAKSRLDAILASQPPGSNLCVAMIDIDHFKSVNDTFGHPVGDQVIRSLAWLLKGRLRATDAVGRYGGEEFLVIMPGAKLDEASSVLDRIRITFQSLPHAHGGGALYASFSAGIAAFPIFDRAQDLVAAADDALLEAKRAGRNQVVRALSADRFLMNSRDDAAS